MTPFDISALPGKKRALYHICVLLIYALIGWIWETVTLSAMAGHYVKRGFLILPFCLIYGFGANFILLLYRKLKKLNPAAYAPSKCGAASCIIKNWLPRSCLQG